MHHETRGYHVYRGDADASHFTELTTAAIPETQFTDATAQAGQTYTYAVTAEEWSTLESAQTSNLLKVTSAAGSTTATVLPAISAWDKTAPPAVNGFQAHRETDTAGQYRLTWTANGANDLRHYNIYFSASQRPDISAKCLLVSPPPSATGYLDWSAPADTDAYYAITAVDRQGNESAPTYVELHR
jgi:fibronectin type 3 domain-containing protein